VMEYREQVSGDWLFEPFKITERATWENWFMFSSTFQYDIEADTAKDLTGSLGIFNYRYQNRDRYLLTQDVGYDFTFSSFTTSKTTLDLWDFKTELLAQNMIPVSPLGTPLSTQKEFLISTLKLSYYLTTGDLYLWMNRIALNTNITTNLDLNFQACVKSLFTFNLQFTLKIYRFLDIGLKIGVKNENVFRYFPGFVDAVNADPIASGADLQPVNFFEDLLKSFNFFNIEDRYDSFFKLQSLGLELTHYLDDWIFKVSFSGIFQNQTLPSGTQVYNWVPAVTFSLKWLPIPQIERKITGDATGYTL